MLVWRRTLAVGTRQERNHGAHGPDIDDGVTPTTAGREAGPAFQLPAAVGTGSKPYWLLEKFSVSPLLGAGLSQSMLQDYFNNPQTFLIVKSADPSKDSLLPDATYVMAFSRLPTNDGLDLLGVDTLLRQAAPL